MEQWLWLWDGYWAMEGDRHAGMGGVGPTPFAVVDRWAESEDLNPWERHEALSLIRVLDGEYLKFQREQDKRRERKAKSKSRPKK